MSKRAQGGNGSLDKALRDLLRAQAQLAANSAEADRRIARAEERLVEISARAEPRLMEISVRTEERFIRIEAILNRLVDILPEAFRERIGIKSPMPKPAAP